MDHVPQADGVFRLLTVCTANQCRSPMAEVIAADLLAARGVDAAVASCGVMDGGRPASPGAVKAMSRRGLDLSGHVSHQMDPDTIAAADLVITMERSHITTVADVALSAVERTFTLTEIADLASVVGFRRPGQPTSDWIRAANAMRHPSSVLTMSEDGDIHDPMGGSKRAYRRAAAQIEGLLTTVIDAMFPTT